VRENWYAELRSAELFIELPSVSRYQGFVSICISFPFRHSQLLWDDSLYLLFNFSARKTQQQRHEEMIEQRNSSPFVAFHVTILEGGEFSDWIRRMSEPGELTWTVSRRSADLKWNKIGHEMDT